MFRGMEICAKVSPENYSGDETIVKNMIIEINNYCELSNK